MPRARSSFKKSEIPAIVKTTFGLDVAVKEELDGYDDQNFFILATSSSPKPHNIPFICEHGYVFKILNSEDSKAMEFIDAQTEIILHAVQSGYPTPAPVTSVNSCYRESIKVSHDTPQGSFQAVHVVRLFEFRPGKTLDKVPLTAQLCHEIGWYAGQLDKTLQTCSVKDGLSTTMTKKWNLSELPSLKQDIHLIESAELHLMVEGVINEFDQRILQKFSSFAKGIIHSDFNECNILVEKSTRCQQTNAFDSDSQNNNVIVTKDTKPTEEFHICGIVDFGDTTKSLYIFELAIAIAYATINKQGIFPMEAARNVLTGYLQHIKLPEWELKYLRLAICGRLVQSLVMGRISFLNDPDNKYILKHAESIRPVLELLWQKSDSEMLNDIMKKL